MLARYRLARALAALAMTVGFAIGSIAPAQAFGTVNIPFLGYGEHEKLTRVLAGVGFEPATLDLLAGKRGKYGGVGEPDNIANGSLTLGSQHCDGADWLPGDYPQSKDAADAAMRACVEWFRSNLGQAVEAAGLLVDEQLRLDPQQTQADFGTCRWPRDYGADATAKCSVLNRLGRALHLAQDFYSHSNWSDAGEGTTPEDPPGLDRAGVPDLMRYRLGSGDIVIPDGLITGCDDSLNKAQCRGRVSHSVLNKDLGSVDAGDCWVSSSHGNARAKRRDGDGRTNFQRAVCGAVEQTHVTWQDVTTAIVDTYGALRGALIIEAIQQDKPVQHDVSPSPAEPTDVATEEAVLDEDDMVDVDTAMGLGGATSTRNPPNPAQQTLALVVEALAALGLVAIGIFIGRRLRRT